MGAGHTHEHDGSARNRWRLGLVLAITMSVLVVEVVGALVSGSLALLADAAHMLTDVAGLSLAMIAAHLATRPGTDARTWGFRRAEVVAASAQAALLLAVGAYVVIEGLKRLVTPEAVSTTPMIIFGVIGLIGNAVGIALLSSGRGDDLNMRAAFLEVVNDALGSAAVLIAAVVIAVTGWTRADAVASLLIGALILPRTLRLLRESVDVLMEATPRGLDLADVRRELLAMDHVHDVHDVHATQVATGLPVITAHIVVDDSCFNDGHLPLMLDDLQRHLRERWQVEHSTFQFEAAGHLEHETAAHS